MQTENPALGATLSNGMRPPRTLALDALEAQRKVAESTLADDFQNQAIWLLDESRKLRKGLAFDAAAVRAQLAEWLGADADLCGQLQALDFLEHPGSAARPRSLQRPRP